MKPGVTSQRAWRASRSFSKNPTSERLVFGYTLRASIIRKQAGKSMSEFSIGSTLLGRYRIESELGSGGMAQVFAAFDVEKNRHIALKVLRRDQGITEERRKRFLREFEILSRFESPSIISVYDIHETENSVPFFTMEKVDGESLAVVLKTRGGGPFSNTHNTSDIA